MAISIRSEAIIQLGKKITKELGLDDSVDTLGRWMAHYIAELITKLETADPMDIAAKQNECFDAILMLWQHRNELAGNSFLFYDKTPILRSLMSLDPENTDPRYRNLFYEHSQTNVQETDKVKWLKLAEGLDYSAKVLISYCLTMSSSENGSKAKEHLVINDDFKAINENPNQEEDLDIEVLRKLVDEHDLLAQPTEGQSNRSLIKNRLNRLTSFVEFANQVISDLNKKLSQ